MNTDIEHIIIRVFEENVSEEEMHIFSAWFHGSEENKNLFFRLKHIYDSRKQGFFVNQTQANESWERLKKKLERMAPLQSNVDLKTKKRVPRVWQIAVAASVSIVLIIGAIFFYANPDKDVVWVEVRTQLYSRPEKIELPDGSFVQLNASSLLKYPQKFQKKQREVYLDGEALFDVVKHNGQPFVVHSKKQQIHVLGTKFNVTDYSSDAYSVTTLITGKIQLETFDAANNVKNSIVMNPNQQVSFDKNTEQLALTDIADLNDITSWTTGVYSFQDTPLEQIVSRLEKMYGVIIVISDDISRKEKYTGKFSVEQRVDDVVKIINFKNQFDVSVSGNTITLRRKK